MLIHPYSCSLLKEQYSGYPESSFSPSLTGLSPFTAELSSSLQVSKLRGTRVLTPHPYRVSTAVRFALFRFHSPSTNGISIDFFSLRVLRCFTSPRSSSFRNQPKLRSPIGTSRGQPLHASNPCISQLGTSFFSERSPAIHQLEAALQLLDLLDQRVFT